MKSIIIAALIGACTLFSSSIYTRQFTTLGGTQVAMAQYQGKKMLIVNIASASEYAGEQIAQLETLYQQYGDSLEVVAFPSNDFGHEPRNNTDLKLLLQETYHTSFPVSVITGIKENTANLHPVYKWLQDIYENGSSDAKVNGDFQKYLLDKDGTLIGVFGATIKPLDSAIINAITQ